jgi:transposase
VVARTPQFALRRTRRPTGEATYNAVGDPNRFLTSRKLVAYLGLDPRVKQSGQTPARSGPISKRGSPSARWALVNAAWTAVLGPGPLHGFYSAPKPAAGTARQSSRPPASSPSCSGACSPAQRTTPTNNHR